MAHEVLIKRTIYVAKCQCGWQREVADDPPRETLCPDCKQHWVAYEESSYIGPSLSAAKSGAR
jgi:hypothetical protein